MEWYCKKVALAAVGTLGKWLETCNIQNIQVIMVAQVREMMVAWSRMMMLQTEVGLRDFYKEILVGHSDKLDLGCYGIESLRVVESIICKFLVFITKWIMSLSVPYSAHDMLK